MMRRGLAAVILGLSLLIASASWAGFILGRTVLNPDRSEKLAEQLLDNEKVQDALVRRLADSVDDQLPPELPIPRQAVESSASVAIESPATQALLIDALVEVHQNALNGVSEPVIVDASALAEASRAAVVGDRPEADALLPATPDVEIELPTAGLSWLGSVRNAVGQFTATSALVALAGFTISLIVAKNRGAVLRRAAFWGFAASAFWLALGYGLPWLANTLSPTSGAVAAAVIDIFFGAMIQPAVALAVASGALFVAGLFLPAIGRRRGARLLQPSRPAPTTVAPRPAASPTPRPAPRPAPTQAAAPLNPTKPLPTRPVPTRPLPTAQRETARPVAPGQTVTMPKATPKAMPNSRPAASALEWEEGVGYVGEGDG